MAKDRLEEREFMRIADELSLSVSDVRSIVHSFFGTILSDARNLPFDTESKIYLKDKFDSLVTVRAIPYIGRLGPVYSRYLQWRRNESKSLQQKQRSVYRSRLRQSDIEATAAAILAGDTPPPLKKRKPSELYKKIWVVGNDGKKLAHQVITLDE